MDNGGVKIRPLIAAVTAVLSIQLVIGVIPIIPEQRVYAAEFDDIPTAQDSAVQTSFSRYSTRQLTHNVDLGILSDVEDRRVLGRYSVTAPASTDGKAKLNVIQSHQEIDKKNSSGFFSFLFPNATIVTYRESLYHCEKAWAQVAAYKSDLNSLPLNPYSFTCILAAIREGYANEGLATRKLENVATDIRKLTSDFSSSVKEKKDTTNFQYKDDEVSFTDSGKELWTKLVGTDIGDLDVEMNLASRMAILLSRWSGEKDDRGSMPRVATDKAVFLPKSGSVYQVATTLSGYFGDEYDATKLQFDAKQLESDYQKKNRIVILPFSSFSGEDVREKQANVLGLNISNLGWQNVIEKQYAMVISGGGLGETFFPNTDPITTINSEWEKSDKRRTLDWKMWDAKKSSDGVYLVDSSGSSNTTLGEYLSAYTRLTKTSLFESSITDGTKTILLKDVATKAGLSTNIAQGKGVGASLAETNSEASISEPKTRQACGNPPGWDIGRMIPYSLCVIVDITRTWVVNMVASAGKTLSTTSGIPYESGVSELSMAANPATASYTGTGDAFGDWISSQITSAKLDAQGLPGYLRSNLVVGISSLALNLVGMAVLLTFLVIGLSSVLRIQPDAYSVKKMLPNAVLGYLIAFLGVPAVRVLVEATDYLSSGIFSVSLAGINGKNTSIEVFVSTFAGLADEKNKLLITSAGDFDYGLIFQQMIVNGMLFFSAIFLFVLGFMFLFRNLIFIPLAALAPLAFFGLFFQPAKSVWDRWWKTTQGWAFMNVVASFWLWLGFQFMLAARSSEGLTGGLNPTTFIAGNSGTLIGFAIGMFCIFQAMRTPFTMAGEAAKMMGKIDASLSKAGKATWGATGGVVVDNAKIAGLGVANKLGYGRVKKSFEESTAARKERLKAAQNGEVVAKTKGVQGRAAKKYAEARTRQAELEDDIAKLKAKPASPDRDNQLKAAIREKRRVNMEVIKQAAIMGERNRTYIGQERRKELKKVKDSGKSEVVNALTGSSRLDGRYVAKIAEKQADVETAKSLASRSQSVQNTMVTEAQMQKKKGRNTLRQSMLIEQGRAKAQEKRAKGRESSAQIMSHAQLIAMSGDPKNKISSDDVAGFRKAITGDLRTYGNDATNFVTPDGFDGVIKIDALDPAKPNEQTAMYAKEYSDVTQADVEVMQNAVRAHVVLSSGNGSGDAAAFVAKNKQYYSDVVLSGKRLEVDRVGKILASGRTLAEHMDALSRGVMLLDGNVEENVETYRDKYAKAISDAYKQTATGKAFAATMSSKPGFFPDQKKNP